jgi:hypothetical protein
MHDTNFAFNGDDKFQKLTKSKTQMRIPKWQNSEYIVIFLDPKFPNKSVIIFVSRWNSFLNKAQVLTFLIGFCRRFSFILSNFKILSIFSLFQSPKSLPKMTSDSFYGEICLTKIRFKPLSVGMSNFKILSN